MAEERKVHEEAKKLARKLGDEEWKNGSTKYALEAYEVSDITTAELLEKARALLEAERLRDQYLKEEENSKHTCKFKRTGHGTVTIVSEESCAPCQSACEYGSQIAKVLKWNRVGTVMVLTKEFPFRAAAVACLKTIKRMSLEQ